MAFPQNAGSRISSSRSNSRLASGPYRGTSQVGVFISGTRAPSIHIQPIIQDHTATPSIKPKLQQIDRTTHNGVSHLGNSKPTLRTKFGNIDLVPKQFVLAKPSVETSAKRFTNQRVASDFSVASGIDFVASTPPYPPTNAFLRRPNSLTGMGHKQSKYKDKSSSSSGGKNKTDEKNHKSTRDQCIFWLICYFECFVRILLQFSMYCTSK